MVHKFHPKVVVISESNYNITDNEQRSRQKRLFPDFTFFDKTVGKLKIARVTVMVREEIMCERVETVENEINSMCVLKFPISKRKDHFLCAT